MSKLTTTKEIREQLGRYLAGELESRAFREWFAMVLRDSPGGSEVEQLAHSIEWAFVDLERGVPADEVRRHLSDLATDGAFVPVSITNIGLEQSVGLAENMGHGVFWQPNTFPYQSFPWSASGNYGVPPNVDLMKDSALSAAPTLMELRVAS
jgi:hypothetical protein